MNTNPGLLGKKLGMTQFFNSDTNRVVPCTVVEAGPCFITQVKTPETDGYSAIQIAFYPQKKQRLTKAKAGHFAKAGVEPRKVLRELRVTDTSPYTVGQELTVDQVFQVGQLVDCTGTSKGKGFGGVMKRWNFKGFIRSHGTHEFFRHGGSIGTRLTPGHVAKGKKMPGQLGNRRATVMKLTVVKIEADKNLVYIKGGIPGAKGTLVKVQGSSKA